MDSFDIMKQPWLSVEMPDGKEKEVSLYEAIVNAHKIKCLKNKWTVNISEYVIYGFLCDFIQNAYKPTANPFTEENQKKAIVEMWEKGCFDKETLDSYIEEYEANGFTFDLFDEERPFLQCSKKEFLTLGDNVADKTLAHKRFGNEWGSGSTPTFWQKAKQCSFEEYASKTGYDITKGLPGTEICAKNVKLEDEITPSISEYVVCLLYGISYSVLNGGGTSNTVLTGLTGTLPILVLNKGNTLFETIVASVGVAKNYNTKPFWEKKWLKGKGVTEKSKSEFSGEIKIAEQSKNFLELFTTPIHRYYHSDSKKKIMCENRTTPEPSALREACVVLTNIYPRIIKTVLIKKTDGKNTEFEGPMSYNPVANFSKDSPSIKTQRLSLGKESSCCKILSINLEALKEDGYREGLKTVFYCIATKCFSRQDITERQETFEWDASKEFPSKLETKNRLDKILRAISECARITAKYTTIVDEVAVGQRVVGKKNGRTAFLKEGKEKVVFSTEALNEVLRATKDSLFEIEEIHYDELCRKAKSIDESFETLERLVNIVVERFVESYDNHRVARNSILVKAIVRKYFIKEIKGVIESARN